MTEYITDKFEKTFDYFLSTTPISNDRNWVIQILVDGFKNEEDGSAIRYNLTENSSPEHLNSNDFAWNWVFCAKL